MGFRSGPVLASGDIPSGVLLLVAIGALVAAPLLGRPFARGTIARAGLDAFVVFGVASLVFFHVLPELFEQLGIVSVALVVAGFVAARVLDTGAEEGPAPVVAFGAFGALALHTALDGAALAGGHDSLGVAIVLHRIPVGLLAWTLVSARFGRVAAVLALMALGGTTLLGYVFAEAVHAPVLAAIQASVAGALLHVLVRRDRAKQAARSASRAAGLFGALLGFGLLAVVPGHPGSTAGYGARFLAFLVASAPALLLGYAMAGILAGWLPRAPVRWVAGGSSLRQAARGVLFGLPLPICSCGVVPVYYGLVRRGMPAAAGFSFLVATPELGVESVLLSLPLLGEKLTALRVAAAAVVALTVGVVAARFAPRRSTESSGATDTVPSSPGDRVRAALRYGLGEVVESTAPWILAGLAVAAAFDEGQVAAWVSGVPGGVDVLIATLVGLPMYVCASGATPLAAALIFAGVSPGAAVAFLLSGPATNVTTFGVLSHLFDRRLAVVFGATVVGASVAVGLSINRVLPTVSGFDPGTHLEHAAWWQWASVAVFAVLVFAAAFRRGVFGLVGEVVSPLRRRHSELDVQREACDADDCCTGEKASVPGSMR